MHRSLIFRDIFFHRSRASPIFRDIFLHRSRASPVFRDSIARPSPADESSIERHRPPMKIRSDAIAHRAKKFPAKK
jgi:hypothetical protein